MNQLKLNIIDLDDILNTVRNLPEAGSSAPAEPVIRELVVSENGTYTADNGVDGYSPVIVEVPEPDLPELSNPGTSADLIKGKELLDGDGNIVTGIIETKTESDVVVNGPSVTVPAGYYDAQTVKSVKTAAKSKPSISVGPDGVISASVTQEEGYVSAGTESTFYELTTKPATIITPTTSPQTAVDAGLFTTGDIVVDAIPDEYVTPSGELEITKNGSHNVTAYASVSVTVPIPDGYIQPSGTLEVTVNGTYDVTTYQSVNVNVETSGGVDNLDGSLDGTLTEVNSNVTKIIDYACHACSLITTVNLPNATDIGLYAFKGCSSIETVNIPSVITIANQGFYGCSKMHTLNAPMITTIGAYTFRECKALKTVKFQHLTSLPTYSFYNCPALETADFSAVESIASYALQVCSSLTTLILRTPGTIVTLDNTNALTRTPIASGTGFIYVPRSLLSSYQSASNWSTYASQFRAIEDYPEITGG